MSDDTPSKASQIALELAARFAPADMREHVQAEVERSTKVRDDNDRKRRVAARAGGSHEAAEALKADNAAYRAAKTASEQELKRKEKAAADAELRKPRKSRRRRKADAFAERGKRLRERMERHLVEYKDKLRAAGQADADPIGVPVFVHALTQAIMADPTGHTARIKLASIPPRVARKIIAAALSPRPYRGHRERRDRTLREVRKLHLHGPARWWQRPGLRRWTHPAAIRTVAVALALFHMRRRTNRKGFVHVVRGMPRRMFCQLAADGLTGVPPGLSALFGNMDEVPGAMRALEGAGLIRIQQPPGLKVEPCDRGPSGFAFNTYWFYGSKAKDGDEDEPTDAEQAEVARMRDVSLRHELGLSRAPPKAA
jgi:hypothetical protein